MNKNTKIKAISLLVILYMIAALTWWAILLDRKNEEILELKTALAVDDTEISNIQQKYRRQEKMIIGEGLVFGLALIAGLYYIYRVYRQEVRTNLDQKNFLLSITHETKTPIAAMKLVLQTIKKRELPHAQQVELATDALEEADRLDDLINKLLFSAKFEKTYQLNKTNTDINQVIHSVLERYKPIYPSRKITYDGLANDDHWAFVDEDAVFTIVSNLVENALKYSNGPVNILTKKSDNQLVIKVTDHGKAISAEEQNQIFNKFYRIGDENTRTSKGTGLGLYICKELAEAHGGSISIQHKIPQGNIFQVNLKS